MIDNKNKSEIKQSDVIIDRDLPSTVAVEATQKSEELNNSQSSQPEELNNSQSDKTEKSKPPAVNGKGEETVSMKKNIDEKSQDLNLATTDIKLNGNHQSGNEKSDIDKSDAVKSDAVKSDAEKIETDKSDKSDADKSSKPRLLPSLDLIKETVNIVEHIFLYEELKNEGGGKYVGTHQVSHGSEGGRCLHVDANKGVFQCFHCNAGGSILDYEMDAQGIDIVTAAEDLCAMYGIDMPSWNDEERTAFMQKYEEIKVVSGILQKSFDFYHSKLTKNRRQYYHDRGLSDKTIDENLFGYASDGNALSRHMRKEYDYDSELLLKTGLFYKNENGSITDRYKKRFVMPYWLNGKIVYSIGRSTDPKIENHKKYVKHLTHSEKYPYVSKVAIENVLLFEDEITGEKPLLVAEGVFDAHLARQEWHDKFEIISPVTTSPNKAQTRRLAAIIVKKKPWLLYFVNDNDKNGAGRIGSLRTIAKLLPVWKELQAKKTIEDCTRKIQLIETRLKDYYGIPQEARVTCDLGDSVTFAAIGTGYRAFDDKSENDKKFADVLNDQKNKSKDPAVEKDPVEIQTLRKNLGRHYGTKNRAKKGDAGECFESVVVKLRRPPEKKSIDLADYIQAGRADEALYWIMSTPDRRRAEWQEADEPKRFFEVVTEFVKGQWKETVKSFRSKYLADEIMLDGNYYLHHAEQLWQYKKGVYENVERHGLPVSLQKKLWDRTKDSHVSETVKFLEKHNSVDAELVNANDGKVNLRNGIYNIVTEKLSDHDPYNFSTTQLPVLYDPKAKCPSIDKFLDEVLPPDTVDLIFEMIGYCLMKNARYEKAFMMVGKGANGKSTLLKMLEAFLGEENVSNISMQDLSDNRFKPAELEGKLANIYADLDSKALRSSEQFKMITSGDSMTAERKHKDPFKFRPFAKQVFCANKIPKSADRTHAFYRRLIIIDFPNTFGSDKANKANRNLIDDITTPEELSGLLNHAVKGLKRLTLNGRFSENAATTLALDNYQLENDSVRDFLNDYCEEAGANKIAKSALYKKYEEFCKGDDEHVVESNRAFNKRLLEIFETVKEGRFGKTRTRVWLNLKEKED